MSRIDVSRILAVSVTLLLVATEGLAVFSGTDVFLASVGRRAGAGGSDWYTTVWVHNPNSTAAEVQFFFLERDRENTTGPVYNDTISPGDTVRYEDAVALMFGIQKFGALRVVANQRLVVNSRIYSSSGNDDADSVGQFFAAIPASFAVGAGESTQLLGAFQTAPKADSRFRYNFGFVEASGESTRVRVTAYDETAAVVGSKEYDLRSFEARQFPIEDLLPGVDAENLRLQVEVLGGNGRVIAFGSGLANRSNDPSTFEMQFRDGLLAVNSPVVHDGSLTGDGSASAPLAVADGGIDARHLAQGAAVSTVNGIADDVTITGTNGISVSTAGSTLTVAAGVAPCPQCVATNIFRVSNSYPSGDSILFTVPTGKTRYITGVLPAVTCESAAATANLLLLADGQTLVQFALGTPPWTSGGGAPLVATSGQVVKLRVYAGQDCSTLLTVAGFEF